MASSDMISQLQSGLETLNNKIEILNGKIDVQNSKYNVLIVIISIIGAALTITISIN